jgi:cell division transport system ATP-binding protein
MPSEKVTAIIGPSGCGKSTLLRIMSGLEKTFRGECVLGKEITPRDIGFVFQQFSLLPWLTVYENVAFALQVAGSPGERIRKIVPELLEIVGLVGKEHRYPYQLSGGEQQRVVVARALAHRPKIIVADEPTGNLDALNTKEVIDIFKQINAFGTTVLLVTHNREVVNALKTRVITIKDGTIVNDAKHGRYQI